MGAESLSKASDMTHVSLHLHSTSISAIVVPLAKPATSVRGLVIVLLVIEVVFSVRVSIVALVIAKVGVICSYLVLLGFSLSPAIKQLVSVNLLELVLDFELVLHHLLLRFQQQGLLIHLDSLSV